MKRFIILFVFFLYIALVDASLGITPAKIESNFQPNTELTFDFTVFSENPEGLIEVYTAGDLTEYATLSRDRLVGGGSFKLTLKLPASIDKPGENIIQVRARGAPDQSGAVGTQINVGAIVKLFVPYPGRFITTTFNVPDGNMDSKIPVTLDITNRGIETLIVKPKVEFFSELGDEIYFVESPSFILNSTYTKSLHYELDTQGYKPGNYMAIAKIIYGSDVLEINDPFRVGSLFINITNYTETLPKGGVQKFRIGVDNLWNGKQEGVFADVNISNSLESFIFRTPSIDLDPWQRTSLEGFLDTDTLDGEYDVNITLKYAQVSSNKFGKLVVNSTNHIVIYIGIGLVLILIGYVLYRNRRKWLKNIS